jgi:hypothetical protein
MIMFIRRFSSKIDNQVYLQKAARHHELAIEVIMPLLVCDAENANLSGIFKGARRGIQVYESLNISNMSLKAMELGFRRQVLYND